MSIHQLRINLAILDKQLTCFWSQLAAQALMGQVLGRNLDARRMGAREVEIDWHCLLQTDRTQPSQKWYVKLWKSHDKNKTSPYGIPLSTLVSGIVTVGSTTT